MRVDEAGQKRHAGKVDHARASLVDAGSGRGDAPVLDPHAPAVMERLAVENPVRRQNIGFRLRRAEGGERQDHDGENRAHGPSEDLSRQSVGGTPVEVKRGPGVAAGDGRARLR